MTDDLRLPPLPGGPAAPPAPVAHPPVEEKTVADGDAIDDVTLWDDPVPTFTDLSGAAGSGKTFAVKAWADRDGRVLRCATTGIAAINCGGSTINAVLGYFDTKSLQEQYLSGFLEMKLGILYRCGVRRLVIDEKSMLSGDALGFLTRAFDDVNGRGYVLDKAADTYDAVENTADGDHRMGLTLVGDFAQLPPVKETYAFESPEWQRTELNNCDRYAEHSIRLTRIRRQADADFVEALRAARLGQGDRVVQYLMATGGFRDQTDDTFNGPTIMAKNHAVDRYNWLRLSRLTTPTILFTNTRWGKQRSEWGSPTKPSVTWNIPERLALKQGALVMVLANQRCEGPPPQPYLYVNGDLGILESADVDDHIAYVRLHRTGNVVPVTYVTRDLKEACDARRRDELRKEGHEDRIDGRWEIVGQVSYMPLRVAYATTCHKSQGLSLDAVQISIKDAFFKTPGMMYVALSRVRTRAGLHVVGTPKMLIERCTVEPKLKEWL